MKKLQIDFNKLSRVLKKLEYEFIELHFEAGFLIPPENWHTTPAFTSFKKQLSKFEKSMGEVKKYWNALYFEQYKKEPPCSSFHEK